MENKNMTVRLFPILIVKALGVFSLVLLTAFPLNAQDIISGRHHSARGLIIAAHQPVISSQISGVIHRISVNEGETFKKGQLLVAFDDDLFRANKEKTKADLEAARAKLENTRQLARLQSVGELAVALAEAELRSRQADMQIAEISLKRCLIVAPFNGRLVTSFANEHEALGPNQKILELVSTDELEIEVLAPSSWLGWLKPGLKFQVESDEGGHKFDAKILTVGAVVDPVSKMVKIRGRVHSDKPGLLPGMTTSVRFLEPNHGVSGGME